MWRKQLLDQPQEEKRTGNFSSPHRLRMLACLAVLSPREKSKMSKLSKLSKCLPAPQIHWVNPVTSDIVQISTQQTEVVTFIVSFLMILFQKPTPSCTSFCYARGLAQPWMEAEPWIHCDLTSSRTHHQYLMDHFLHGAQVLLPQVAAIGTPQGYDPSLPITFEVRPFLHDLTHLRGE